LKVFLANNSGLGDYIFMNGATRWISSQSNIEHVDLLCIGDHNKFRNISWMYRDNPKITVHPEPVPKPPTHRRGRKKIKRRAKSFPDSHKRVFYWDLSRWWKEMPRFNLDRRNNCFPELFYAAHEVPFCARHENFFIERDFEREEKLFDSLNLPSDYAFCVETSSERNHGLNVKSDLFVFKPHIKTKNRSKGYFFGDDYIFDWMTVIERAKEIHAVDTSWFHLIKSMRLDKPKYYHHVRVGPYMQNVFTSPYVNDNYDNGWEILDKNGNVIESHF
tara:strand:+ start:1869 stop:2693 length:825 start_codon:yes stop_codon:yes gene_type:complete